MSIGERITQLRQENNLSQLQLAKALDISRQAVSKWENDLTSPDTINLIRLADVLNTEVEYLATGKKPVYTYPVMVDKIKTVEKIVEVEKPVYLKPESVVQIHKPITRRVYRTRYIRNPIEFMAVGLLLFAVGLLIGLCF